MQLPKGFTLRGNVSPGGNLPALVKKTIAHLDAMKFKEVVTTFELSSIIGVTVHALQCHATHPAVAAYRYQGKQSQVIWGSKRTIAELKRQMEKQ
jgi:hypothetical protein